MEVLSKKQMRKESRILQIDYIPQNFRKDKTLLYFSSKKKTIK